MTAAQAPTVLMNLTAQRHTCAALNPLSVPGPKIALTTLTGLARPEPPPPPTQDLRETTLRDLHLVTIFTRKLLHQGDQEIEPDCLDL